MDKNNLNSLHKSFKVIRDRKIKLLEEEADRINDLKEHVKEIRKYSIDNLEDMVQKAINNFQENGMEAIFAENSETALQHIYQIIKEEYVVSKSKSNTINEIGLSPFLESKGIELVETDLGDRIIQIDPDTLGPSHPIGPAAHLDMNQIAEIASKKFKKEVKAEPREILDIIKADVLKRLEKCNIGITGANSVAAEDGALLMVHNEGNITLVSMKDIHIVVIGIDKLVRTIEDAVSVVKLETIFATGKKIPAYMNVISSPSKTADIEQILLKDMYGAKRVVVILLDNGRSKLLKEYAECLMCIGCGSCIVSCPVYNVTGSEFGYRGYLGGRGIAFSRFIRDENVCFDSGLFKCTTCGQCTIECPVNIKTNKIIEKIREESVNKGIYPHEHAKTVERIKKEGSPF
ncbi:MAG: LUD domain-containing protein [Methanobacterium sp.]